MANITFMIGNGFDISCGLHTSYADFYKWLFSLETADLRVERLKLKLKEDKTVDNNYWSDFELWLGQYTVEFNEVFLDEFLHPFDSVHELMIQFIRNERAKISNQLFSSDGINGLKNSVLNFYQELPPISRDAIQNMLNSSRENVVFQFITFNYTDCIDLCVKGLSKEPHYEQATIYGKELVTPVIVSAIILFENAILMAFTQISSGSVVIRIVGNKSTINELKKIIKIENPVNRFEIYLTPM